MNKTKDITKQKFGRLTAIKRVESEKSHIMWMCICDCGNEKIVRCSGLINGNTRSCGCLHADIVSTHGRKNTRLYKIWKGMKERCYKEYCENYHNYGGRGIKICDDWLGRNGFQNFYEWSMKNGYTDELTIDRKDVNGNYEPSNCRWETMKIQQNNRRNNLYIEIEGITKTATQWSDESGVEIHIITNRFKKGVTGKDIIAPKLKRIAEKQSGEKNVIWSKSEQRWIVRFRINGKQKDIALFKDVKDAIIFKYEYLGKLNQK